MASDVTYAREGYTTMLDALIDGLVPIVRLFTNDVTPTEDSVRADFVEAVAPGVGPIPADRWTPAALRAGIAFAVVDPLIWEYVGAGDGPLVRGYFVTAGADGPLLWAWRRPGAGFQFSDANRLLTVYVEMRFRPC
jgi:hypothetical protein